MSDQSTVSILFSVLGAEAITGAFAKIQASSANLAGSLAALGGVALSINSAFEGLKGAMNFGADLTILASRIGSTVESVVVLSRAFEMGGLSADRMGIMVNRLQKAVSGVNEMGKSTKGAFGALGLTPESLQGLKFEDQLEKLAQGFQKIQDPAQRAAIAMDLFGREGGQMLTLLTKQGLLGQAAEDAGRLAQRMGQDAGAFKSVGDQLSVMKLRMQEMWVVALEQLLPALEKIGNVIKGLNLGSLGAALGSGGAIALAGGLAAGMATRLDTMILGWATSPATSAAATAFAANFVLPLTSGLATLFKTFLPPVIIAAIAGAIIVAVAQAIIDANNRIDAIRGGGASAVHKVAASLSAAQDQAQYEEARKTAMDVRDKMQKDLDAASKNVPFSNYTAGQRKAMGIPDSAEMAQVETLKKSIKEINDLLTIPPNQTILDSNAVKRANLEYKSLVGSLDKLREQQQKDILIGAAHPKQLEMLKAQQAELERKNTSPDTGLSAEQAEAKHLSLAHEIAVVEKEIETTKKAIIEDTKKQVDQAALIKEIELESQILQAHAQGRSADEQALKEQLMRVQLTKQLSDMGVTDLTIIEQKVTASHQEWVTSQAALTVQKEKELLQARLNALQGDEALIQRNIALTENEKWASLKANLAAQIALYDTFIAKLKEERDLSIKTYGAQGNTTADALQKQIDEATKGKLGAEKGQATIGPPPELFSTGWTKALTKFRNDWTITGASIATSMATAMSSIHDGFQTGVQGLIRGTMTWHDAWRSLLGSAYDAFAQMVSKMIADWVFGEAVKTGATAAGASGRGAIGVAETIFHNVQVGLRTAAHFAGEVAKTAITLLMTPVRLAAIMVESMAHLVQAAMGALSAMASIPYVGPILAIAAMAAVLAAGIGVMGMAKKGFATGGYTGEEGGEVHPHEFVFSAPAVQSIGLKNLQAMHAGAVSGGAGRSGGRSSSGRPIKQIFLFDTRQLAQEIRRDSGDEIHIVDVIRRRKGEISEV